MGRKKEERNRILEEAEESQGIVYLLEQALLFFGVVAFIFGFWFMVYWLVTTFIKKGG